MNIVLWDRAAIPRARHVGTGHVFRYDARSGGMVAVDRRGMAVIGILEILGAVGLIAPAVTGMLVWLTLLAAALIALLMAFAIVFHLRLSELFNTPINVVLLIIAGSVAYGRFVMAPF